jgi:RimJ/RimL family protein N-acetyltransferase
MESDLPVFFEQQLEPEANRMAAFPPRDHDAFLAHWAKILGDRSVTIRTILFREAVAGNIGSWEQDGRRLVGYWIGKEFWGRGIATKALLDFLVLFKPRPLHAHVAKQNRASIRVLEKGGFTISGEDNAAPPTGGEEVEEFIMTLLE